MFFFPLFLGTLTLCIKDYGGRALENSISGEEGGFFFYKGWMDSKFKQQEQFLEFVLTKLGNLSLSS